MEKRVLDKLYGVILSRKTIPVEGSYTCKLFESGRGGISKKVGEEAVETILSAYEDDKNRVVSELADLFYHILVFMANEDITLDDVYDELSRRESGEVKQKKALYRTSG
ncbi:MAG: phosphoribosyl-ATP diphosphatase [Nitrospirae bacterium YQR-1]